MHGVMIVCQLELKFYHELGNFDGIKQIIYKFMENFTNS
jgi:hypothetical protein